MKIVRVRKKRPEKQSRVGPTTKKILLLLKAGLLLSLTHRPDTFFRIIRATSREWRTINKRALYRNIRRLYESKLVDYRQNNDGAVTVVLTDNGKRKALRYDLDKITVQRPASWDKLWRVVAFDVPERFKEGRNALAAKLKQLGFHTLQKSVFIHPFDCKNEVEFIVEVFNLKPYVRFLIVQETDIDIDLKNKFKLR